MSGSTMRPWALVTGASSGIGRACALTLAEAGYNLMLVGRRDETLRVVEHALRITGADVRRIVVDLATDSGVDALIAELRTVSLRAAVLAAGYGSIGPFIARDPADESAMVTLNCTAVVRLSAAILPQFVVQRAGHLVLFGSIVGFGGVARSATYAATKNFVQSFAEGLQGELAGSGVNVLCVAPGPTDSGFAARAGMTMGRALPPDVVARAVRQSLTENGTITPGVLTKVLHYSLATLGRRGRSFVLGQVMRGMEIAAPRS
jgi:hypothetical protein